MNASETQTTPATRIPEQGGISVVKEKDLRKKFGVRKAAIVISPNARAYRRAMSFSEQHSGKIDTASWVIIDPSLQHPSFPTPGTVIRANTYDGNLGAKQDILNPHHCRELPTEAKVLREVLKGYTEVPVSEVPFVVLGE